MSILINVALSVYVLVALLMILVILMQRPKSEGLGAAFGGGVTENIFGAQTTNVLTKITGWLAGIFFVLSFVLSVLYAHRSTAQTDLRRELMKSQGTPAGQSAPAVPGISPVSMPQTGEEGSSATAPPAPVTQSPAQAVPPADAPVQPAPSPKP